MFTRTVKPSPALLVALLALFVALGGSVYAATLAPKNSVNSAAVINGQIKGPDLGLGAVALSKISAHARNALKGQTGPRGVTGPRGIHGDTGRIGPTGPRGSRGPSDAFSAAGSSQLTSVSVPAGDYAATASVYGENATASRYDLLCSLSADGQDPQHSSSGWSDVPAAIAPNIPAHASIAMNVVLHLDTAGTIRVYCISKPPTIQTSLTAVQVGAIHR